MAYKLVDEDVDFWAGYMAREIEEMNAAQKLAGESISALVCLVAACGWTPGEAVPPELQAQYERTGQTVMGAGYFYHQAGEKLKEMERTIKGARGSKQRQAELERIKARVPVLKLIQATKTK